MSMYALQIISQTYFVPSVYLSYLSELLNLGSFHPNDGASQALVNQQTQLTVEVHAIILLVLCKVNTMFNLLKGLS